MGPIEKAALNQYTATFGSTILNNVYHRLYTRVTVVSRRARVHSYMAEWLVISKSEESESNRDPF